MGEESKKSNIKKQFEGHVGSQNRQDDLQTMSEIESGQLPAVT
jgi:hypothetical protein